MREPPSDMFLDISNVEFSEDALLAQAINLDDPEIVRHLEELYTKESATNKTFKYNTPCRKVKIRLDFSLTRPREEINVDIFHNQKSKLNTSAVNGHCGEIVESS